MPFCRRSQLDRIEAGIREILNNQELELNKEKQMAATLADLDAELAKSDTSVAAIKADNDKIIAILQAAPPSPDVTAQLTHLQNVNAALTAIQAEDDAALAPPASTPPAAS
jgi:molybdopterin converting factor small subunit